MSRLLRRLGKNKRRMKEGEKKENVSRDRNLGLCTMWKHCLMVPAVCLLVSFVVFTLLCPSCPCALYLYVQAQIRLLSLLVGSWVLSPCRLGTDGLMFILRRATHIAIPSAPFRELQVLLFLLLLTSVQSNVLH